MQIIWIFLPKETTLRTDQSRTSNTPISCSEVESNVCQMNYHSKSSCFLMYAVVQFYPGFNFYFPLFLCMVMYDNELRTKENEN